MTVKIRGFYIQSGRSKLIDFEPIRRLSLNLSHGSIDSWVEKSIGAGRLLKSSRVEVCVWLNRESSR